MPASLDDTSILTWLWHDAEIFSLHTTWSDDGEAVTTLRCRLHEDEDRQTLIKLGIQTRMIDVLFHDVWWQEAIITGYTASREVVSTWDICDESPLLDKIRSKGIPIDCFTHHQISGSGGSTISIVCGAIKLEEVKS